MEAFLPTRSTSTQLSNFMLLSRDAPYPDATPTTTPVAEEQERNSSLALTLVLILLIGSFFTSYYLKIKKITAVHETIVGLFAGMFVGLALRLGPGEQVQSMLSFSNTIMLNVLLPPIILASGYDLRQVSRERGIREFLETFTLYLADLTLFIQIENAGNGRESYLTVDEVLMNLDLPSLVHSHFPLVFSLSQENFFRNFGVILTFAFAGTFISAVVIGYVGLGI